jgi:predicted CXXCH cytochrome family protein
MPRGDYKVQACYACHREVEVARHWPSRHDSSVACRDCHPAHAEFRAALPQSILPPSLQSPGPRNYDWQLSNESCLQCHSSVALTTRLDRGFVTLNTVNYHELHLVRGSALCIECHQPHGSVKNHLLRSILPDNEHMSYIPRPDGGSCTTNCHGVEHSNWDYRNRVR